MFYSVDYFTPVAAITFVSKYSYYTRVFGMGNTCISEADSCQYMIKTTTKKKKRVFFNPTVQKHLFFSNSAFFTIQFSHPCMTTRKTTALTRQTFVGKVMSLLLICYIDLS